MHNYPSRRAARRARLRRLDRPARSRQTRSERATHTRWRCTGPRSAAPYTEGPAGRGDRRPSREDPVFHRLDSVGRAIAAGRFPRAARGVAGATLVDRVPEYPRTACHRRAGPQIHTRFCAKDRAHARWRSPTSTSPMRSRSSPWCCFTWCSPPSARFPTWPGDGAQGRPRYTHQPDTMTSFLQRCDLATWRRSLQPDFCTFSTALFFAACASRINRYAA